MFRLPCRCSLLVLIAIFAGIRSVDAKEETPGDVPRIVPLRVPADQISRWFPEQVELKGMKADAFDLLIEKVQKSATRRRSEGADAPRLLKSRHEITWNGGVLEGKSTLVLDSAVLGRRRVLLDPWTPAIDPSQPEESPVVADDLGHAFLIVDFKAQKNATREITWKHGSRPGSAGRKFSLGLPRSPVRELQVELPKSLKPEGGSTLIRGPFASQKPNHWIWVYDGESENIVLALVDTDQSDGQAGSPRFWAERTTRVNLNEGAGTLQSDWSLPEKARRPSTLRFQISPGVEILEVHGENLVDFKVARKTGLGEILTIRVGETPSSPADIKKTSFQIKAMVNAPDEGAWSVPSIAPLNGVVVKGTTIVVPGPNREVTALRPENGRRIESKSSDPAEPLVFTFDDQGADSVATFEFRRKRGDVSVEIHGELFVGNAVPRLEAYVGWKFLKGRRFDLDVDLPLTWQADRVELVGVDDPIAWHPETRPGGEARLHIALPAGDWKGASPILRISAIASVAGGRGSLMLPRIRPIDARVSDETWVANVEQGYRIVPTESKGLAWIEPTAWTPFPTDPRPNGNSAKKPADPSSPRKPADLAWRWLTSQGEARVERQRAEESTRATIDSLVTLTDENIDLLARISVQANAETARSILIGLNSTVENPQDWRVTDESTGQELARESVDLKTRFQAKIPGEGTTWKVELPSSTSNRRIVRVEHVQARRGKDWLPLILLPSAIASPGLTVIRASRNLQTEFTAEGVRVLDPVVAMNKMTREFPSLKHDPSLFQSIKAFEPDAKTSRIELRSQPLARSGGGGLIERLLINSTVEASGPAEHRFRLDVIPGEARSISIELPRGVELVDIRRDGLPFAPQRQDSTLVVPLALSAPRSKPIVEIELDVQTFLEGGGAERQVEPPRLKFSLACLATRWLVNVSGDWRLMETSSGLLNSDPAAARVGGPGRFLREVQTLLGISQRPAGPSQSSIVRRLSTLETVLKRLDPGEWEIAPILQRWNESSPSILVDRFALDELGATPRTRVKVDGIEERAPSFTRNLRAMGMTFYPVGNVLILTSNSAVDEFDQTRSDHPNPSANWQKLIKDVLINGGDETGRFQIPSRWRDETEGQSTVTAHPPRPRGEQVTQTSRDRRRTYRFSARGWPEDGLRIRFEDHSRDRVLLLGGIPCVLLLAFGISRWTSQRLRSALCFGVLLLAINGLLFLPTASSLLCLILLASVSVLALADFASGWRTKSRSGSPDFILGSRQTNSGSTMTVRSIATIFALGVAASSTLASPDPPDSMLVLYPYDGPPDPSAKPTRVLMRLADYNRLDAFANQEPPRSSTPTDARSMVHRPRQVSPDEIEVTTEMDLLVATEGPSPWRFPIGESRKISATADGKSIPITIEAGGKWGELRFESSTSSPAEGMRVVSCVIKRSLIGRPCESGLMISLPVNPHPRSKVVWSNEGVDWVPTVAKALATETLASSKERSALIGPAPTLEVQWGSREAGSSPAPGSMVDALYLWDLTPAGDRLRSRLLINQTGGANRLRLQVAPGLLVKDFHIPGEVDVTAAPTAEGSTWEARIDPPLPEGTAVEIEFWRPNGSSERNEAPARDSSSTHSPPAVQVVGVEKTTAALGFRRPPEWNGRLTAKPPAEMLSEENFSRTWGDFPDENLTLSGALKLGIDKNQVVWPTVECSVDRPTIKVEPTLKLQARKGRVDFNLEATLLDPRGTSHDLRIDFPIPIQLTEIAVEGLTSWTSIDDRSLNIRFDGPALPKRRLEVTGWIAVETDQPGLDPRFSECAIPWPKWPGQTVQSGMMSLLSTSKWELVKSPGAAIISSDQEGLGTASGTIYKRSYRVDDPLLLGSLRWETAPPKVNVRVLSHLTINPETASWVSRLGYTVSGGPLELIHLKLPTVWARNASVQLEGMSHQKVSESRGEATYWTIRPEKPVWGSVRLNIRASQPLIPSEPLAFPDIGPLGRGEVDTYLELTNATRNPPSIEGSSGLKPIASIGAELSDDFVGDAPIPPGTTYYHVTKPGWSLRVSPSGMNATSDSNTLDHAEIEVVVSPSGEVIGRSVVQINGFREVFIPWTVVAGDEILAAWVNARPTPIFVNEKGQRLVPGEGEFNQTVTLIWRSRARPLDLGNGGTFDPPKLLGRNIPAVLTVFVPDGSNIQDPTGSLSSSSIDAVDLTTASWIQRELRRSVDAIDRGSRADTDRLTEGIKRFESKLNDIKDRTSVLGTTSLLSTATIPERADQLQRELTETLASYSLEEFQTIARNPTIKTTPITPLGVETTAGDSETPTLPRIGKPLPFSGTLRGSTPTKPLVWTVNAPRSTSAGWPYFVVGFLNVVALGVFWLVSRTPRKAA